MKSLFNKSVAIERTELLVRLIVSAPCSEGDREIAIAWIAETLEQFKIKNRELVKESDHH